MNNLSFEAATELLSAHGVHEFRNLRDMAKKVGYYEKNGTYELTYGHQDADVSDFVELLKQRKLTRGKNILEVFGGSAFESHLISKEVPGNNYYSLDIQDGYYDKTRGIKYLIGDAFKPQPVGKWPFDFVFVGNTNKSCCSILTVKDFMKFSEFCNVNLKKGGMAVISFFDDTNIQYNDFYVEVSSYKIVHKKQYKGLYCHWGLVTQRDTFKNYHRYYPMCIISKYATLAEVSKHEDGVHDYIYSEPETYRSWDAAMTLELMETGGFEYIGNKFTPNTEIFPFVKK